MASRSRSRSRSRSCSPDEPFPTSWSDKPKNRQRWKQMQFNLRFLKDQRKDGPLVCHYCHRADLRIYHWSECSSADDMATADHVVAKANGGAAFSFDNLVLACRGCNMRKADK
mmetsp:Transcript_101118/g.286616  ORF Transcript_101118/g.286616 Transcript_101118/m.286616 type:complete len:113 (-) Transcript_101118:227-565(-)